MPRGNKASPRQKRIKRAEPGRTKGAGVLFWCGEGGLCGAGGVQTGGGRRNRVEGVTIRGLMAVGECGGKEALRRNDCAWVLLIGFFYTTIIWLRTTVELRIRS